MGGSKAYDAQKKTNIQTERTNKARLDSLDKVDYSKKIDLLQQKKDTRDEVRNKQQDITDERAKAIISGGSLLTQFQRDETKRRGGLLKYTDKERLDIQKSLNITDKEWEQRRLNVQ